LLLSVPMEFGSQAAKALAVGVFDAVVHLGCE
jgi:hypothetical protein